MLRIEPDLFWRLCLAREMLREDPQRPASIVGVAGRVRVAPLHLIRRFEELFG